jgi:hypothetical protein
VVPGRVILTVMTRYVFSYPSPLGVADLLAVYWVKQEENNGLTFVTYCEVPGILSYFSVYGAAAVFACLLYSVVRFNSIYMDAPYLWWARGSIVGRSPILQAGRSRVRIPMKLWHFELTSFSQLRCGLELTQPLTEMSTRNLHEG